jgi:hypothetical protein
MNKTKTQENAMHYAENYLDRLLRRHDTGRHPIGTEKSAEQNSKNSQETNKHSHE